MKIILRTVALAGFWLSPFAHGWTLASTVEEGWQTRELLVYVNTANCTVSDAVLLPLIDQALATWNGVASANVTLSRSPTASTATVAEFLAGTADDAPVILCDTNFGTDNSTDPGFADQVPAATRIGQNNPLDYAGILLNAQSGANDNIANLVARDPNLLVITLAHELGHVLGLGHSSRESALMYYSIANKTQAKLTSDDIQGITFLYPRNEFTAGSFGCANVRRPDLDRAALGWFVVMLAMIFAGRLISRRLLIN